VERLWPRTRDQQIGYHLDRNDTPDFTQGQPGRIDLAHFLIEKMFLKGDLDRHRRNKIIELGAGSADISGPYSNGLDMRGDIRISPQDVLAIDVVPQSAVSIPARFPDVEVRIGAVEDMEPEACDLLIMCEFLEHVDDPVKIVQDWLPKARWAVIGHPLNEPNPPYETGHIWSYTLEDWQNWFAMGGHHIWERLLFPMGYYDNMVLGHSCRMDQPPFAP
jgi:hypothetical protein